MITTLDAIVPATLARPAYLARIPEPGFDTTLERITGDAFAPIPNIGSTWGLDSRQGYSRRQPENSDGSLLYFEQRNHPTTSKLILDGHTFTPILSSGGTSRVSKILASCTEVRWMPHPNEMIGLLKSVQALVIFDVLEDREIRRIPVGAAVGLIGEGNLSNDCSVVALGNTSFDCVLVDVLNGRVGPLHRLIDGWPSDSGPLDNLTVSPLSTNTGGKLIVKATHGRVYDYDVDLKLTPHPMDPWGLRMAGAKGEEFAAGGLIAIGSHMDAGVTPDNREVFVGGIRDQGGDVNLKGLLPSNIKPFDDNDGRIVAIHIETGIHTHISAGKNQLRVAEAYDQHSSCRGPLGWVGTGYAGYQESHGRFACELVLWKLDGSRECVRFGVTRTNEGKATGAIDPYRNEAHGVWSRDGKRVIHASNDQWDTINPGDVNEVKAYVHTIQGEVDPPPPAAERYYVDGAWTYQPTGVVMDRKTGRLVPLDELARAKNVVGP